MIARRYLVVERRVTITQSRWGVRGRGPLVGPAATEGTTGAFGAAGSASDDRRAGPGPRSSRCLADGNQRRHGRGGWDQLSGSATSDHASSRLRQPRRVIVSVTEA